MNMKRLLFVWIVFFAFSASAQSRVQSAEVLKGLSPDGESLYQQSMQAIKAAVYLDDYTDALMLAKKILIFDPDRADVCYRIGEMALLIGDITANSSFRNEAIRYFEKAVALDSAYISKVNKQYELMTMEEEESLFQTGFAPQSATQPVSQDYVSRQAAEEYAEEYNDGGAYLSSFSRLSDEDLKTIQYNTPVLYEKYTRLKAKYRRFKIGGWIAAGVGTGLLGISVIFYSSYDYDGYISDYDAGFYTLTMVGGIAGIGAGVPLIVVGTVKGNRLDKRIIGEYNNKIRPYHSNAGFSVGSTSNGKGFLVTF
jgi:tetratricopeptide (TPR) repeat protein